jgi:hypothetical protein
VLGTLLYWARAFNPTIIPATSALASEQAAATENGYFFLSSATNSTNRIHNDPLLTISTVYKNVLSSVMEA